MLLFSAPLQDGLLQYWEVASGDFLVKTMGGVSLLGLCVGTCLVFWLPWSPWDSPARQVVSTLLAPSAGDHLVPSLSAQEGHCGLCSFMASPWSCCTFHLDI